MTLPDAIRAALAAQRTADVPDDAPPAVLDMLRWVDYHLRSALTQADMAMELLDTLRPLSDADVARIIDEVQDGE